MENQAHGRAGFLVFGHPDYQNDIGRRMAERGVQALRSRGNEITFSGKTILDPVSSRGSAVDLLGADLDCIILFMGTWVEPPVITSFLKEVPHLPVLIWGFPMFPNESGKLDSTGSFVTWAAIQGPLKRTGTRCRYILGAVDDPVTLASIDSFINVARAGKALRRTRLGLVGYAALGMYSGTVDHLLLSHQVGPEVVQIDGSKLIGLAERFPEAECAKVMESFRARAPIDQGVSKGHLVKAARIYLAARALVAEYALDAINVKCQYELSQDYGCIACVPLSLLAEEETVCACEGDVLITVTMTMLHHLTRQVITYGDVLDAKGQNMYLSSCGFAPFSLAHDPSETRIRDIGHKGFNGPLTSLTLKRGRLTYARLNEGTGSYQLTMGTGTGEQTELRQGRFPALNIRIDGSMDRFLSAFQSQHYAICYGDRTEELSRLCELLGIGVEQI